MSATSLFRTEVAIALAVAFVIGLVLLVLRPQDRASTRNAMLLLASCALAIAAESGVIALAASRAAGIVADVATVLAVIVLIRLVGILLFRVLLPLLKFTPARIVEDLVTIVGYVVWKRLVRPRLKAAGDLPPEEFEV